MARHDANACCVSPNLRRSRSAARYVSLLLPSSATRVTRRARRIGGAGTQGAQIARHGGRSRGCCPAGKPAPLSVATRYRTDSNRASRMPREGAQPMISSSRSAWKRFHSTCRLNRSELRGHAGFEQSPPTGEACAYRGDEHPKSIVDRAVCREGVCHHELLVSAGVAKVVGRKTPVPSCDEGSAGMHASHPRCRDPSQVSECRPRLRAVCEYT